MRVAASTVTMAMPAITQALFFRCGLFMAPRRGSSNTFREISSQRAFAAQGFARAAVALSGLHDQGMQLIKPGRITGRLAFDQPADVVVFGVLADPTVTSEHPLRVSVHNEYRVISRVEEN